MKSLKEKKLLARLARNSGAPDLALEESIRREEQLEQKIFATKPEIIKEDKLFVTELQPDTNSSSGKSLVQQAVEVIHAASSQPPVLQEKLRDAEISGIRQQVADLIARMGTLSWGGGGTGVVRFADLDDHQRPADVRTLEFNTAGSGMDIMPTGTLAWNPNEDCLDIYQADGTVLQTGLEQYIRVHNMTGSTVDNGKLVMFAGVMAPHNGYTEWVPMIDLFDATNGVYPPLYVIGITTEAIANGENGRATTFGKVRHLDTTGTPVGETWAAGDLLWASTTPGELTNVQPTAPNVAVSIAAVMKVDATDGEILVRPSIFPQLHMGTFYSTVSQTASIANTAYAVTFNSSGLKCPHVNLANTDAIQVNDQGLYKFEFRLHLQAPKNHIGRVWIWARVDGVDVPSSATEMSLYGSGTIEATMYPSWSFQQSMAAGSTFQLMWATDNTQLIIYQPETTAFAPASRSAAMRVTQVNL